MTVRQTQCLLDYLGYDPGPIDGLDGANTRDAVKAFQRAEGLGVDGIAGKATQAALLAAVAAGRVYVPPDDNNGTGGTSGGAGANWWSDIKYFSRDEPYIACPCGRCGGFPVEPAEKLMRLADAVREDAGKPMVPTSTVRCDAHNAEVGGVPTSRHRLGHAMDFVIPGLTANQILAIVRRQEGVVYCYAIDGSAVHMDIGN